MKRRIVLWIVALSLLLPVLVPVTAHAQPNQSLKLPQWEDSPCQFEVPAPLQARCGYLIVPERRTAKVFKPIRLHVGIFEPLNGAAKPDPILYLEGGPGGYALERFISRWQIFAPYMQDRTFIVLDQRGTGYSEPLLQCPEVLEAEFGHVRGNESQLSDTLNYASAVAACKKRLINDEVDLAAFNTAENAADVADLRRMLNIGSWNLYGISYGTRLALITMRDYPTGIRSVILDSSYPPQVNRNGAEFGRSADRAIRLLFENCQADDLCNSQYPNLREVYRNLTRELNRTPFRFEAVDSATGAPLTLTIDGYTLESALVSALYSTPLIPYLPRAIYDASEGDFSYLGDLVSRQYARSSLVSQGMYFSMMCGDRSLPPYLCSAWGVSRAIPGALTPVTSGIPTLVLAGEYDPVTPPSYGKQAVRTLRNGFYFEFKGYGHGISIIDGCARLITSAFLENPRSRPEDTCLAEIDGVNFEPRFF